MAQALRENNQLEIPRQDVSSIGGSGAASVDFTDRINNEARPGTSFSVLAIVAVRLPTRAKELHLF